MYFINFKRSLWSQQKKIPPKGFSMDPSFKYFFTSHFSNGTNYWIYSIFIVVILSISIPVLLHYDRVRIELLNQLVQKLHNQRIIAQKLSFCVVVTVISLAFHRIVSRQSVTLFIVEERFSLCTAELSAQKLPRIMTHNNEILCSNY